MTAIAQQMLASHLHKMKTEKIYLMTLLFLLLPVGVNSVENLNTSFLPSFMTDNTVSLKPTVDPVLQPQLLKIITEGDVVFGGLFPIHEQSILGGITCGAIKYDKGVQRLEAMLYAVDLLNADPNILPGLKIGVHVLDTCGDDTFALEQCMDFIKAHLSSINADDYWCKDKTPPIHQPLKPVAGVIGAANSPVSMMVANILRLFKIPQISFASTSADLSDKTRFEYFSRVVPPDNYQAQAMADIARALGWTYVNTLADSGTYGEKGIQAFVEATKNSGLCISRSESIPRGADDSKMTTILDSMLSTENNARAIMMFVNEDNLRRVVRAISKLNKTESVYLLASDSWGVKVLPVYKQETAAEGTVTILPKRSVVPGFDQYFLNLTLNNTRNPWFKEFWADLFNCSIGGFRLGSKPCTGKESLLDWTAYKQEGLIQFVIDSVYALAQAAHNMLMANCPDSFVRCPALKRLTGPEFLQYIRNVSFTGISGDEVTFNENGDSLGRYDIHQFQRVEGDTFAYIKVGEWTDRLYLNMSLLKWKNGSQEGPISVCSDPCQFGYARIPSSECCWMCVPCKDNEYMSADQSKCLKCQSDSRPNATLTGCERLPIVILVPSSLWFVLPVVFSVAGVLCTIFVFGVFVAFNNTPIIMASGRELCYILLFGIALSYCTSVAMLARPSLLTCAIRRLGLGVSLCFVYAAILTKTNRIYRIFSVGIKAMVKRPSYTSPRSQILICSALVSVQIAGAFTWLGFEKPNAVLVLHEKDTLVLRCRSSQIATIVSLFYNIFLIILCTVYAFKTRKIPQNFNEAKYIAFTMYSTCIVWLAFVPIYFGANHDFKIEVTSLCMCVNISATVSLFCLFAPKVYIVLLQPHKNIRQTPAGSLSANNKNNRPFYESSSVVSAGGQLCSYHDLNGGVYCGDIPANSQLPVPSRERKSNAQIIITPSTPLTTRIVSAESYNERIDLEDEDNNEEMLEEIHSIDNQTDKLLDETRSGNSQAEYLLDEICSIDNKTGNIIEEIDYNSNNPEDFLYEIHSVDDQQNYLLDKIHSIDSQTDYFLDEVCSIDNQIDHMIEEICCIDNEPDDLLYKVNSYTDNIPDNMLGEVRSVDKSTGNMLYEINFTDNETDHLFDEIRSRDIQSDAMLDEIRSRDTQSDAVLDEIRSRDIQSDAMLDEIRSRDIQSDAMLDKIRSRDIQSDAMLDEIRSRDSQSDAMFDEIRSRDNQENYLFDETPSVENDTDDLFDDIRSRDNLSDHLLEGLPSIGNHTDDLLHEINSLDSQHDSLFDEAISKENYQDHQFEETRSIDNDTDDLFDQIRSRDTQPDHLLNVVRSIDNRTDDLLYGRDHQQDNLSNELSSNDNQEEHVFDETRSIDNPTDNHLVDEIKPIDNQTDTDLVDEIHSTGNYKDNVYGEIRSTDNHADDLLNEINSTENQTDNDLFDQMHSRDNHTDTPFGEIGSSDNHTDNIFSEMHSTDNNTENLFDEIRSTDNHTENQIGEINSDNQADNLGQIIFSKRSLSINEFGGDSSSDDSSPVKITTKDFT